jgi:hypothetical protein
MIITVHRCELLGSDCLKDQKQCHMQSEKTHRTVNRHASLYTVFYVYGRRCGPVSTSVHVIEGVLNFLQGFTGSGAKQGGV